MSCTSNLVKIDDDLMITWCPGCGEKMWVYNDDYNATLDDGTDEYELWCEDCLCHFYTNVNYL